MDQSLATLKQSLSICCTMFQHWTNAERFPVSHLCLHTNVTQETSLHWFSVETLCSKYKETVSALPNVGPYIYDVSISGFTRNSIYIYDISSLRVKQYKFHTVNDVRTVFLSYNQMFSKITIESKLCNSLRIFSNNVRTTLCSAMIIEGNNVTYLVIWTCCSPVHTHVIHHKLNFTYVTSLLLPMRIISVTSFLMLFMYRQNG